MKAKRIYTDDGSAPDMTMVLLVLAKFCPDVWAKLMTTEIIWNAAVPRAATDSVYIYMQRAFWDTLNDLQRAFTLAHEMLHIWLAHMQRGQFYAKQGFFSTKLPWIHDAFNAAADFIINAYLIRCGLEAPPNICLSDKYNGNELTDEVYAELVAKQLAEASKQDQPEQPDWPEGFPGHERSPGQPGDEPGDDSDEAGDEAGDDVSGGGQKAKPKQQPSAGHDVHFDPVYEGTPEEQAEAAEADRAEIQRDVDDVLDSAEAEGRGAPGMGEMAAGGYRRRGENVRHSNVAWAAKLAHVVNRASNRGGRQNWGKIHRRRLIATGVLTPTRKGRINLIAVTEDISYSVSETARDRMHKELAYLIDSLRPVRGALVLFTNTRVVDTAEVRTGHELLNVKVPHGGGTTMSAAVDYMQDKGINPDVHLIFTDGEMCRSDYAACAKAGAILILDGQPNSHYAGLIRDTGCEHIIID